MPTDNAEIGARARLCRRSFVVLALMVAGMITFCMPLVHAAPRTVEVSMTANKSSSGGLAFNGYQRGAMVVTVPAGWQIAVHFENVDTSAHSLAVLPSGTHTQMAPSSAPVFAGATTQNFTAGLAKGSQQTFTFEASKPGTYEFLCGVPGHAVTGQWDTLVVSASAEAPSVTPAGAATLTVK